MILLFSSWQHERNIMFRGQLERKTSEVVCQCFLIKGSTVAWGSASQQSQVLTLVPVYTLHDLPVSARGLSPGTVASSHSPRTGTRWGSVDR